jgi:SAM-dependent MidA family methyltransferase
VAPTPGPDAGATVPPALAAAIDRHGPVGFDTFVEIALYDEATGFYTAGGGRAGRGSGDFLTSPEVGPLFGVLVGHHLDRWWEHLGRPDPFVVVEAGAGPATLAVAVRAARPACAPALTWLLVERSAEQRARHGERLDLTDPVLALPPAGDDETPPPEPGRGPRFTSLAELPPGPVTGVVLANELLDNLPFRLVERGERGWSEVRVGWSGPGAATLAEVLVPLDEGTTAHLEAWAPGAPPGARVPVQEAARAWLRAALDLVDRGGVVVLDYADDTASMAERGPGEWLRTYRDHRPGGPPLEDPGAQDITCEVAVDQLAGVRAPDRHASQADFLAALGIEALVEEGRRTWLERAHIGDLEALRARSRVREAEALCDPAGLGAFHVLEWDRTGPG